MGNFIKALYISLLLVFFGFIINAFIGVKTTHNEFINNSLIYIFVQPQANQQDISQRLSQSPQIASFEFVTNERVFENAINEKPELKGVIDANQNPFFSYFIVKPLDVSDESAKYITKFASQLPGVNATKYDPQIFLYAKKINDYVLYFSYFSVWLLIIAFVSIMFLYFWRHRFNKPNYKNYIFYKSLGVLLGGLVSLSFYLLALYVSGIFVLWPSWYYYAVPVVLGATFALMFFDISNEN